jgi:hypothetical protein
MEISCVKQGLVNHSSTYVVIDRVATREEDKDLLFQVPLQERE